MTPESTRCQLTLCDCRYGLPLLPPESVDVVITSPPSSVGRVYRRYHGHADRDAYLEWTLEWVLPLKRALKREGSFFLNIGATLSNPLLPHKIALLLSEHFVLQNTLHWIKSIPLRPGATPVPFGDFRPVLSPRYVADCHEYIFHFTKEGITPVAPPATVIPVKNSLHRCGGNNWFIPDRTFRHRNSGHHRPAAFPVELASRCLDLHAAGPEAHVVDPFLGTGSTALAAIRKGVAAFTGFEIDPGSLEEAGRRLARFRERQTTALRKPFPAT